MTSPSKIYHPLEAPVMKRASAENQVLRLQSTLEHIPAKVRLDDVQGQKLDGLKKLMAVSAWRDAIKSIDLLLPENKNYPHVCLQLKYCRILSLMKLRNFVDANTEITQLGNENDNANLYQTYPDQYPKMSGSMYPFGLKVLKAQLPHFLKAPNSMDSLFELLAQIRKEIAYFDQHGPELQNVKQVAPNPNLPALSPITSRLSAPQTENVFTSDEVLFHSCKNSVEIWNQREITVICCIVTRYIQQKEFLLALQTLDPLIQKYPQDQELLCALGRIYLQMGNLKYATHVFEKVTQIINSSNHTTCLINSGYLALAKEHYKEAVDYFEQSLAADPHSVVAANNLAISLLFLCGLSKAITRLESFLDAALRAGVFHALDETLVFNLCTLYDLKCEVPTKKKKLIMELIAKCGSDGFDMSLLGNLK